MLIRLVADAIGTELNDDQANSLARLVAEWFWWPRDLGIVPNLAAEVVARGFCPGHLTLLAGMSRFEDPWEIREAFIRAMVELGLDWSNHTPERRAALLSELCCELIRRGLIRPTLGAQLFAHEEFYYLSNSESEAYLPLVGLVVEWEEEGRVNTEQFDRYIRDFIEEAHLGEG